MADHYLRGCTDYRAYRTTLNVNVQDDRLAAAIGVPIIRMKQGSGTYNERKSETLCDNMADILGTTIGNCRTNAGLQISP